MLKIIPALAAVPGGVPRRTVQSTLGGSLL